MSLPRKNPDMATHNRCVELVKTLKEAGATQEEIESEFRKCCGLDPDEPLPDEIDIMVD